MRPLLATKMASPVVGVAAKTLDNWRSMGVGPKFIKSGRRVFYDPADLEAWNNANRFSSTSEVNGGA